MAGKKKTSKKAAPRAPRTKKAPTRKRGRPTIYTKKLADQICREIASGKSLREVCEPETMPDESTVRGWAIDDRDGFFPQYDRACRIRAEGWAEEIIEIADDGRNDYVERVSAKTGKKFVVLDSEHVTRSTLRVNTRKWYASKVLPRFADKVAVGGDANGAPIKVEAKVDGPPVPSNADLLTGIRKLAEIAEEHLVEGEE
jgi:hypothetical protein